MTFKGFTFKYYCGEENNPYSEQDLAAMWWDGEKLFYDNISGEDGDTFIENIKNGYENALTNKDTSEIHKDKSMSKQDHILLFFLALWHSKWFPYDDWDVIKKY